MDYLELKSPSQNKTEEKEERITETRNETGATPGLAMTNLKTPSPTSALKVGEAAIVNEIKTAEDELEEATRSSPLEQKN